MKNISDKKILEILVKTSFISDDDALAAKQLAENSNDSPIDVLYERKLLTKDLLGQAIAEEYNVTYWDLNTKVPDKSLLKKLNPAFAKKYNCLIVEETKDTITIANDNPTIKEELLTTFSESIKDKEIKYAFSLTEDIQNLYIYFEKPLNDKFFEIVKGSKNRASDIVDAILADAVARLASDIHIEPLEDEVTIRFRIDGILRKVATTDKDLYSNVLNRIKVLAGMRIDQNRSAQDGAIRYALNEKKIDIRVSVIPTLDGQKVVLRILSKYIKSLSLEELGLSEYDIQKVQRAYRKTFGMILTTGPTGSGKTTTLYALLRILNVESRNITTIEDPVEYRIKGVNQIQVNPDAGITFASGLRSIVRQDPNVILVGEIRDKETAEIAINAALTGHLVLSTFHANDASTVVPRLIDMGIEPFLIASTLNLIMGQRLVRKIAPSYRISKSVSMKELKERMIKPENYFSGDKVTLYEPKVSLTEKNDGYEGRIGIYETIEMNKDIENLVLTAPSGSQIEKVAKKYGMTTLFEDGITKVKSGTTSLEELLRVVPQDELDELV